jgi:biotin transporter BioY
MANEAPSVDSSIFSTSSVVSSGSENEALFSEIRKLWYQMFLSTLISSAIVHCIGSIVLYIRLRSHRYAKWLSLIIQMAGFATPLLLGSITNALIASILVFSGRLNLPIYAIIGIGLAQTICVVAVGFFRISQTL